MLEFILVILLLLIFRNYVCIMILYMMGWEFFPNGLRKILSNNDKLIIVYPHTTYWDTILMILYRLAYPEILKDLLFLMRPDYMKKPIIGNFLSSIGGLRSTSIENNNGGRTKEIIDHLNSLERHHLVISPKGTIKNMPWRSGYYHITLGTRSNIMVIGFDYAKKRIIFFSPIKFEYISTKEDLKTWLIMRMRQVTPYYPENVEY